VSKNHSLSLSSVCKEAIKRMTGDCTQLRQGGCDVMWRKGGRRREREG
jgi:hypothetical protein